VSCRHEPRGVGNHMPRLAVDQPPHDGCMRRSLRQLELDVATNLQRALPQAARSNEAAYGLEATVSKLLVKVDTLQVRGFKVAASSSPVWVHAHDLTSQHDDATGCWRAGVGPDRATGRRQIHAGHRAL